MQSEEEIRATLSKLEAEADEYEDLYEENFVAIQTIRGFLGLPRINDERRREED